MNELAKIKEVSSRYNVTTRTLRYYEKMGLIKSSRCESSGYRLYDETALLRLRQILILRKMSISIADISAIFDASDSEAVLSVLDRKVDDIDSEVALLHDLKEIVLGFIRQIRRIDFHNDADVKMLYDRACEIETSLTAENTNLERLFDTSDELEENLTSVMVEAKESSKELDKFEIIKMEACRFIGKSVYARAFCDPCGEKMFDYLVATSQDVFKQLDELSEYATEETNNFGLITWEFHENDEKGQPYYDMTLSKSELQGYTVGRFMKPDTPVPNSMRHFDIPGMYVAKAWATGLDFESTERLCLEAIDGQTEYSRASWIFQGDILSKDIASIGSARNIIGHACVCKKKK